MWKGLEKSFSQGNGPKIFQLRHMISSIVSKCILQKLKSLWDELSNYRPLPICPCRSNASMKTLLKYQHQEYVMQFLTGLDESFSHVRGDILLMGPLPPINKVFSLTLQEVQQWRISNISVSSNSIQPAALLSNTNATEQHPPKQVFTKKDKLICRHYGKLVMRLTDTIDSMVSLQVLSSKIKKNLNIPLLIKCLI